MPVIRSKSNTRGENGMDMKRHLMKAVIGSVAGVMGMANFAAAANVGVGVDVNTPNVRVQVGNPAPPPRVAVVERERVIVREKEVRHDHGKHKGHYKKHKKHED
jgi:hypothetical protein